MPVELNYQGNAGVDDMGAFNARLHETWRGDNLFRVYIEDESLYFIRVGGSKNSNVAVGAQFGLLGALIVYFANKRAKKKEQATLNSIAGAHPAELLGSHKYNFVLPIRDIASAKILPPPWLGGNGGRCTILPTTGKKRNCTFDDVDNMRAGIARLAAALGTKLDVNAEYDERKKKFRKPTAAMRG